MKTWEVTYAKDFSKWRGTAIITALTYTKAIVEFMCRFPKSYIAVEIKELIKNESAAT